MSRTPNIDQLIQHRDALARCDNFSEFLTVQIAFVNLLIDIVEKDEQELRNAAKEILGL